MSQISPKDILPVFGAPSHDAFYFWTLRFLPLQGRKQPELPWCEAMESGESLGGRRAPALQKGAATVTSSPWLPRETLGSVFPSFKKSQK